MADVIRILEIVCAVIAIIFAVYGLQLFMRIDADTSMRKNMDVAANAMFLILFNSAAAYSSILSGSFVATYFGYLVTWTGRGLHFLLMGLYIFPTVCTRFVNKNNVAKCFDKSEGFGKFIILGSWLSIIFGIVLLVLRCTIVSTSHSYGLSLGSSQPLDVLSVAALIASAGMLVFGVMKGEDILDHGDSTNLLFWHGLTVAFFVTLMGAASLVSSCMLSPTVGMLFGFLYNCLGRGLFYLCMGFYMFSQAPDKKGDLYYVCSIVSMVVGIVYIVMFLLIRSRPAPVWASSAVYTPQTVTTTQTVTTHSQGREMRQIGRF